MGKILCPKHGFEHWIIYFDVKSLINIIASHVFPKILFGENMQKVLSQQAVVMPLPFNKQCHNSNFHYIVSVLKVNPKSQHQIILVQYRVNLQTPKSGFSQYHRMLNYHNFFTFSNPTFRYQIPSICMQIITWSQGRPGTIWERFKIVTHNSLL